MSDIKNVKPGLDPTNRTGHNSELTEEGQQSPNKANPPIDPYAPGRNVPKDLASANAAQHAEETADNSRKNTPDSRRPPARIPNKP